MSSGDNPNKTPSQSEIPTPWGPIRAPLGVIGALILGFVVAYVVTLLWVIPHHLPILSDPIIEAALTAQPTPTPTPPLPRLVVANKIYPNSLYCIVNGERVLVRIEPPPDSSKVKYLWNVQGIGELTEVRDDLEKEFTVEGKKPGDAITVTLYQADLYGRPDRPISDVRFVVQEVCFK